MHDHISKLESAAKLQEMSVADLESLATPCAWALEDAGVGTDDLDAVWLIGRGSRVPAIAELFEDLFRRRPTTPSDPEGGAARGALLVATGQAPQAQLVSPLTLGRTLVDGTRLVGYGVGYTLALAGRRSRHYEVLQGE